MANKRNGTLYIGSTSNLIKRTWEHRNSITQGFTARYQLHRLVYYEAHASYVEAARREKRLKKWKRDWKLILIENFNPLWSDLYFEICG